MGENDSVEWHQFVRTEEVADGSAHGVEIGAMQIAIYSIAGCIYATDNICTHQFALLSNGYVDGEIVECPLHQARFHIPTGKAVSPPADQDISTYPTKVVDGKIFVGLHKPPGE